jgi:hypothetical protein
MSGFEAFINEIAARITGPLGFRFIIQPLVAILLGVLDGIGDNKSGSPPYVVHFFTHPEKRWALLKSAGVSALKPIIVGIIIDAIAQYLIFNTIHPMEAVVVGTMIIAIPYVITRGLVNRVIMYKKKA